MININRKDITSITAFEKVISKVYAGSKLVWELIHSCFGSGFWINDRSWINSDGWRN